jgi:hypothetical protein
LTGTVADVRLSANVAQLSSNQVFTASNRFSGVAILTNVLNAFAGSFAGNAAGLTNLDAADLTGMLADARLSANVAQLSSNQVFSAANRFSGVVTLTNVANTYAGSFSGNGGGLTNLDATDLTGTVADARLSANVALLSSNQVFTGSNSFAKAVGIGTTTPAHTLEVNASGNAQIGVKSTDSVGHLWTMQSTGQNAVETTGISGIHAQAMPPIFGSFQIWDRTVGASRLMITTTGNVGLGTAPGYALQLAGGAYCDGLEWKNVSDRDIKENFIPIEPREVLEKVVALPVTQWNYKSEPDGIKHLGPVAQDFHAIFGLGNNERAIGTVDESGVALAAIQGLNQKLEARSQELLARSAGLEIQLAAKEAELKALQSCVAELQAAIRRFERLEPLPAAPKEVK